MIERDQLYVKQKKNPENEVLINRLKKLKNKVNQEIKKITKDEANYSIKKAQGNPRKTWLAINNILSFDKNEKKVNDINRLKILDVEINDPIEISNEINKYFQNVAVNLQKANGDSNITLPEVESEKKMTNFTSISSEELDKIVSNLKKNTAAGDDNITTNDFIFLYPVMKSTLLKIINRDFELGHFPSILKISKIIPIYKTGSRNETNNYRPISLLSVFSKVYEKAIKIRLLSYVKEHKFISDTQYGFQEQSSTQAAITDFTEYILKKIDKKEIVTAVFIDLKKAFDTVSHEILIRKLDSMGIKNTALKLLKNYLDNRIQYVYVNGSKSEKLQVKTGVPQGSILGPLLYILYVESLFLIKLNMKIFMYADDTVLVYGSKDCKESEKMINQEIVKYCEWLKHNKLLINEKKQSTSLLR